MILATKDRPEVGLFNMGNTLTAFINEIIEIIVTFSSFYFIFPGKKAQTKAPKIQRLVTPVVLQRKRHKLALKKKRSVKKRDEAAEYAKLLALRMKEKKERKRSRSGSRTSVSQSASTSK